MYTSMYECVYEEYRYGFQIQVHTLSASIYYIYNVFSTYF